jgi:Carboxylesterase family
LVTSMDRTRLLSNLDRLFPGAHIEVAAAEVKVSRYWVNFATHGDPNGPGLPEWPAFAPNSDSVLDKPIARGPIPIPEIHGPVGHVCSEMEGGRVTIPVSGFISSGTPSISLLLPRNHPMKTEMLADAVDLRDLGDGLRGTHVGKLARTMPGSASI